VANKLGLSGPCETDCFFNLRYNFRAVMRRGFLQTASCILIANDRVTFEQNTAYRIINSRRPFNRFAGARSIGNMGAQLLVLSGSNFNRYFHQRPLAKANAIRKRRQMQARTIGRYFNCATITGRMILRLRPRGIASTTFVKRKDYL